jgi:TonB family protein
MKKHLLFALLFGVLTIPVVAQTPVEKPYDLFDISKQPSFPGGEQALMKYLAENIHYPANARENNIQGTVVLTFIVEKNGSISNVQITKDPGAGCGAEAARVVSAMPRWIPGEANGNTVRVKFTLPIRFKLEDSEPTAAPKIYPMSALDKVPVSPKGSVDVLVQYLSDNLELSKKLRKKHKDQTISVEFIVEPNGVMSLPRVLDDPTGETGGASVLQLLNSMRTGWTPGQKAAKPVSTKVVLHIPIKKK